MPGNDEKPAKRTRAKAKTAAETGEKTGKKRAVRGKAKVRRKAAPKRGTDTTRAREVDSDPPGTFDPEQTSQPGAVELHEKAKGLKKTPERTWFIVDMMSRGLWLTRISRRFLAQVWGISESRVRNLSASAWSILQNPEELKKVEDVRTSYRLQCERWAAEAALEGDREEARKLQEQAGKLLGLFENKTRLELGKGMAAMLATAEKVLPPEMAKLLFEALASSADESE